MLHTTYKSLFVLSFVLVGSVPFHHAHGAEGSLSEGSLAISPFLIEDTIAPGQTHQHSIDIFNNGSVDLPIDVSINDFEPAGPQGAVRFFSSNEPTHSRYSLSTWITVQTQPNFIISPKSKTTLTFTITPPTKAEPGSHYGGLLFSQRFTDTAGNTQVNKKLGALVFVNFGKGQQAAQIDLFQTTQGRFDQPPITFKTLASNTGNIHLAPKGKIEIQNIFGQTIGLAYINPDAQTLLPETQRSFESSFTTNWLLGKYKAKATLWYGNPKLELQAATTFWVFPEQLALKLTGFLLLLVLLGSIGVKRYNHWIIRKSMR